MTCDQCGMAYDYGGSTDGILTFCPLCAMYVDEDEATHDFSYRKSVRAHNRSDE